MSVPSALASKRAFRLQSPRWGLRAGALGMAAVLGMVLLLAQASLVASTGYNVERLEELKTSLQRQNQHLEQETASLRSLDRIEQVARSRLKMVTPTSYVYVTVDTLPQDPTPLFKKALQSQEPAPGSPPQPWWEALARALIPR